MSKPRANSISSAVQRIALMAMFLSSIPSPASAQGIAVRADRLLQTYVRDGKFSGAVLVARRGVVVFKKGYGMANVEWSIPNTPSTKFEIASLTKQFTAAAILQLASEGKLALGDPVSKFYPQAPASWSTVTIHHLLTHTSGIPNNRLQDFSKGLAVPYTPDELIATFRDKPLDFAPGAGWKYSNPNFYLLGYIVQQASGQPYANYLQQNIFGPLGMKDSGLSPTLAVVPRLAEGYTTAENSLQRRDYFDRSLELGAGGVHSTVQDLFLWDQALSGTDFLPAGWRARMFAPHTPKMAYGWFIETRNQHSAYYHEGSDPGYSAFILRIPAEQILVVVLSNREETPVREIANKLAALLAQPPRARN